MLVMRFDSLTLVTVTLAYFALVVLHWQYCIGNFALGNYYSMVAVVETMH